MVADDGVPFLGVQGFMVSAFAKDPLLPQIFLTDFVATEEVQRFAHLYDAVVGNSYIPDMVDGIAAHMARLDRVQPAPAGRHRVGGAGIERIHIDVVHVHQQPAAGAPGQIRHVAVRAIGPACRLMACACWR